MNVRRLTLAAIALSFAIAPYRARASEGPQDDPMRVPRYVSITLATTVPEPEPVRAWTSDAIRHAIDDASVTAEQVGLRRLVVEISGRDFAYEVNVGVQLGTSWITGPATTTCKCTGDEFFEHVRAAVREVAPELRERTIAKSSPVVEPTTPRTSPSSAIAPVDEPSTRRMGKLGVTGAVLVSVGIAAMIGGAVVLGIGERSARSEDDADRIRTTNMRPLGGAVLGAGAALTITGGVLLGVDRKRARSRAHAAVAPTVGARGMGLTIVGRF